jgi:hypothetical protein
MKSGCRSTGFASLALLAGALPQALSVTRQSVDDVHAGTLVLQEEAFALTARERGTRAAFLEYLAEDGVLVRSGPVNGRVYWAGAPEDPGLLQWYASRAALAQSSDLGYTLGPWSYGKRAARPRSFGHYLTIWRREPGGQWRVVVNGSISHPKRSKARRMGSGVTMQEPYGLKHLRLDIEGIEQRFASAAQASGYEATAASWAQARSVRLRDGAEPGSFSPQTPTSAASARLEGSGASAAADLAYAYGTVSEASGARGAFVHIWHVLDGEPYLAVDLFTRLEPDSKD